MKHCERDLSVIPWIQLLEVKEVERSSENILEETCLVIPPIRFFEVGVT